MNDNFCMCGAQAGYPHSKNCPYPYFGKDALEMARWQRAYMETAGKATKLKSFLNDLADQEYLPCGCWKSRRTRETFIFCARHLQEDEAQQ